MVVCARNAWLRITSFLNVVVAMSTVSRYETSIELIDALTHDVHPTVVSLSVSLARTHVSDRQTVGHEVGGQYFPRQTYRYRKQMVYRENMARSLKVTYCLLSKTSKTSNTLSNSFKRKGQMSLIGRLEGERLCRV